MLISCLHCIKIKEKHGFSKAAGVLRKAENQKNDCWQPFGVHADSDENEMMTAWEKWTIISKKKKNGLI